MTTPSQLRSLETVLGVMTVSMLGAGAGAGDEGRPSSRVCNSLRAVNAYKIVINTRSIYNGNCVIRTPLDCPDYQGVHGSLYTKGLLWDFKWITRVSPFSSITDTVGYYVDFSNVVYKHVCLHGEALIL